MLIRSVTAAPDLASFQHRIAINVAADDPGKPRQQELELARGAFELVSVDITADRDGGSLRQAQTNLAQNTPLRLSRPACLVIDGPAHEPPIGRMCNGPWAAPWYRHSLQVLGTDGARLVCN
ncbi:hypothetical protein SAMN05216338_1009142 [Bradyrhizobium sp. Rc2d]|nr:hypothetical protein SAMN05216338_1009142 [Bradyrhizobium sp. Rc2d]